MTEAGAVIWNTLKQEFSDISDLESLTRVCLRMLLAVILGAVLGYERERSGKAAGLRTHMLVALGAALFVLVPLQGGMMVNDLSRVLQGVISGIGFLGAGAIIKLSARGQIRGLTTAASIWLTAAIGVAAGMGRESTAVLGTLVALLILLMLRRHETERPLELESEREAEQQAEGEVPCRSGRHGAQEPTSGPRAAANG